MAVTTARFDPRTYGAYMDGVRDDSLAFIITDLQAQAGPPGSVIDLAGVCSLQRPFTMTTPIECAPGARIKATATVTYQGVVTAWEAQGTVFSGAAPVLNGGYAVSGGIGGAASGDLSGNYPGPLTIVAGAVTTGKLADANVTTGKLAAGAATGATLGADVATLTGAQTLTNKTLDATSNARVRISAQTLAGAVANINVNGIPQGFRTLVLELVGRGDAAAISAGVGVKFNGSVDASYNAETTQTVGGGATGVDQTAGTTANIGTIPAASAPANAAGVIVLTIPAFTGTTFRKVGTATGGYTNADTTTGHVQSSAYIEWTGTAAITSLAVVCLGGGNFVAGTMLAVYGEP